MFTLSSDILLLMLCSNFLFSFNMQLFCTFIFNPYYTKKRRCIFSTPRRIIQSVFNFKINIVRKYCVDAVYIQLSNIDIYNIGKKTIFLY